MCKSAMIKFSSALILIFATNSAFSGGITRDIRDSSNIEKASENGGYFEISIGLRSESSPTFRGNKKGVNIRAALNFGYQWNGLFIDVNDDDDLALGYNAFNTEHWSFDLIVGVTPEIAADSGDDFDLLTRRQASVNAGVRATGYYDDYIFQFEVKDEASNRYGGFQATMLAGKSWQLRNLNTHIIIGAHFSSKEFVDYYWGVDEGEVSDTFAQYNAGSSVNYSLEFGADYPLSQSWVFRSKLNYFHLADSVANSPLKYDDSKNITIASVNLTYVF